MTEEDIIYKDSLIEEDFMPNESNMPADAKYPCIVLEGVKSIYELEHLRSVRTSPELSLPLYVKFNDNIKELCLIELTLDYILKLKLVGGESYSLVLYKNAMDMTLLDYNDTSFLESLIKL